MQHSSRYPILLLALVCAFTLGASLRNALVWGSRKLVEGNAATTDLRSALSSFVPSRWRESAQTTQEAYRPVANLTFAIDNTMWPGLDGGYNLSNLTLHMLAVVALYFVSRSVLSDFGVRHAVAGACLSALLLAIHPALVEAAVWIENRAVLVCTTLCLVSFGLLTSHWRHSRRLAYAAALLTFVAALITQEAAVALPLSFALYAVLQADGTDRRARLVQTLPFFAAAAVFTCLRASLLRPGTVMVSDTPPIPLDHRSLAVVRTVGGYLATLLLPVRLCSDRYFVIPRSFAYPGMVSSVAALAVWAAPFGLARRCPRWVWFGLLSVLAALLPVSNIVLIPGRPMADQRLYLPALGACVLAGGLLSSCLHGGRRLCGWLLVAGLCALSAQAIDRVFDFRTEYAFWLDTACKAPRKGRTRMNLGVECKKSGFMGRAEKLYRNVARLYPQRTEAHQELWYVLMSRGKHEEALVALRRAAEAQPATPELLVRTAATLCTLKRYEEAMPYLDQAKSMKGAPSTAWLWSSQVCRSRGDEKGADAQLDEARRRVELERAAAREAAE